MMQLMGKWAYTVRILYWKPYKTYKVASDVWSIARNLTHLGNTGDHVNNEGLDCPQASNMLAAALPHSKADLVVLSLLEPDVHVDMTDILRQRPAGALNGNEAGLDVDGDSLGDGEFFGLEDVAHL